MKDGSKEQQMAVIERLKRGAEATKRKKAASRIRKEGFQFGKK